MNRRYHSIPRQVFDDLDLRALLVPGLRADFTLVETYKYRDEPALDCPISVYGGDSDSTLSDADFEAWREQTSGRFRMQMLRGDHFLLGAVRLRLLMEDIVRDFEESMVEPIPVNFCR